MRLLNNFGSARDQIGIKAIRDDLLILDNGYYRMILETSAVNLELKSDEEQDAITEAYQGFLNGLGWPVQLLIRTREIDMESYLAQIDARLKQESLQIYREQLHSYMAFMKSLVNVNRILTRSFYIVVPLDEDKADVTIAKEELVLRSDIIAKGLERLGMRTRQLGGVEILNLFYSFYNPTAAKGSPITNKALKEMHTVLTKEPS